MPENERYYPATPEETYAAVVEAVRELHNWKSQDDFSMAVNFTTKVSGWSWGATMSASVMPQGDGSIVRVGGEAKVRTNITAKGTEAKKIVQTLDLVAKKIQANRRA